MGRHIHMNLYRARSVIEKKLRSSGFEMHGAVENAMHGAVENAMHGAADSRCMAQLKTLFISPKT